MHGLSNHMRIYILCLLSTSIGLELERPSHSIYKTLYDRMTIQSQEHGIEYKDDPTHLTDLYEVLLEENWMTDESNVNSQDDTAFRKNGSDYDRIVIHTIQHQSNRNSFVVTIPLPSRPGAYRTRIANALDVFLYVTAFIEYYTETTLPRINIGGR